MERPIKRGRAKTRSRSSASRSRSGSRGVSRVRLHPGWFCAKNDSPGMAMPTHEFVRTVITYQPVQQNLLNSDTFGVLTFSLLALPNPTEFTSLFDQYRIDHVDCSFIYSANEALQATGNTPLANLVTVFDHDDASAPTSLLQLQQDPSCMINRLDRPFTRRVYPRIAMAAYSGTFTGYTNVRAQWIDSGSSTVQHYGLKYGINTSTFGSGSILCGNITISMKYYLQMRDVF